MVSSEVIIPSIGDSSDFKYVLLISRADSKIHLDEPLRFCRNSQALQRKSFIRPHEDALEVAGRIIHSTLFFFDADESVVAKRRTYIGRDDWHRRRAPAHERAEISADHINEKQTAHCSPPSERFSISRLSK